MKWNPRSQKTNIVIWQVRKLYALWPLAATMSIMKFLLQACCLPYTPTHLHYACSKWQNVPNVIWWIQYPQTTGHGFKKVSNEPCPTVFCWTVCAVFQWVGHVHLWYVHLVYLFQSVNTHVGLQYNPNLEILLIWPYRRALEWPASCLWGTCASPQSTSVASWLVESCCTGSPFEWTVMG